MRMTGVRRRKGSALLLALLALVGLGSAVAAQEPDAIPGVVRFDDLSVAHLPGPIKYDRMPPPGGPHSAVWMNCGIYDQPVPTEMAVHSLEHGAVWITYRPDLPRADVLALRALAGGQTHVLIAPWGSAEPLPGAVIATAWGLQLSVEDASDPRLDDFVRAFANGPQTPEPGAPCRGGAGTPLPNP